MPINKPIARIDNWRVVQFYGAKVLCGTVSHHPHQSSFKSPEQMTSELVKFEPEVGYAETQATFYILGKPARKD